MNAFFASTGSMPAVSDATTIDVAAVAAPVVPLVPDRRSFSFRFSFRTRLMMNADSAHTASATVRATMMGKYSSMGGHARSRIVLRLDLSPLEHVDRQRDPAALDPLDALGADAGHEKVPRGDALPVDARLLEREQVLHLDLVALHAR